MKINILLDSHVQYRVTHKIHTHFQTHHPEDKIPFHRSVNGGKLSICQFLNSCFLSFLTRLHLRLFFFFFLSILYGLTKTSSLSSSDTMTHSGFMNLLRVSDVTLSYGDNEHERTTDLLSAPKLLPACHTNRVRGQEGERRFFLFFLHCWNPPEPWRCFSVCVCVCARVLLSHAEP